MQQRAYAVDFEYFPHKEYALLFHTDCSIFMDWMHSLTTDYAYLLMHFFVRRLNQEYPSP